MCVGIRRTDLRMSARRKGRKGEKVKGHTYSYIATSQETVKPIDEIAGFPVRPGLFDTNGAMPLQNGVNFTVHTRCGTSCELLLFHKGEEEPYAVLPFPEEYP